MKMIDVSQHQGIIDFEKVKKAGISGVIIRAGYGKGNKDTCFEKNVKGAIAAGLHIGIYWFSYAYSMSMAAAEANYCDAIIQKYSDHIDMPVFFDWEYDSMNFAKKHGVNPTKSLITYMITTFCNKIKAMGYAAGFYANPDYLKNHIDEGQLGGLAKWVAHYTTVRSHTCDIWQYSDKGKVDGIRENVDMDQVINTYVVRPSQKSNEEIADEVIAGLWGTGEDRKIRLTQAGYDYALIQKLVNAKLSKKNPVYYTVKKGDTLSAIAKSYGSTVAQLMAWNGIKNANMISVGQRLRVK